VASGLGRQGLSRPGDERGGTGGGSRWGIGLVRIDAFDDPPIVERRGCLAKSWYNTAPIAKLGATEHRDARFGGQHDSTCCQQSS